MPHPLPPPEIPHHDEAELAVLGCALENATARGKVLSACIETDFFRASTRHVFRALRALCDAGQVTDMVSIPAWLEDNCPGYDRGILSRIAELQGWDAWNVEQYLDSLRDASLRRRLLLVGEKIRADACANPGAECMERALQDLAELSDRRRGNQGPISLRTAAGDYYDGLNDGPTMTRVGASVATGFPRLDDRFGGLRRGALYYLGARPSMGKTTLGRCIAVNAARRKDSVLFVTAEVPVPQMVEAIIAAENGIAAQILQFGPRDQLAAYLPRIARSISDLGTWPLHFIDGGPSTQEIRQEAMALKQRENLRAVIIDRFELLGDRRERGESDNSYASRKSRALVILARDLDLPVCCLVQLNRALEKRGPQGRRPTLSDLRDSGSLEQDAKGVWFLFREGYYGDNPSAPGPAELNVAKNMFGPCGREDLYFDARFPAFFPGSPSTGPRARDYTERDDDE